MISHWASVRSLGYGLRIAMCSVFVAARGSPGRRAFYGNREYSDSLLDEPVFRSSLRGGCDDGPEDSEVYLLGRRNATNEIESRVATAPPTVWTVPRFSTEPTSSQPSRACSLSVRSK